MFNDKLSVSMQCLSGPPYFVTIPPESVPTRAHASDDGTDARYNERPTGTLVRVRPCICVVCAYI